MCEKTGYTMLFSVLFKSFHSQLIDSVIYPASWQFLFSHFLFRIAETPTKASAGTASALQSSLYTAMSSARL